MNSNLLGDNEQLQSNQNNEIKLMNKSRKYLLYASFLLILLSISAFIAHLIVADSLTTYIKTNYAFSIWWSFFNMIVQIYLLYDLYFRFDNENQSFISLKNTDKIIRTVKFSLIGILSFASFISCATINEIAGVWAFFAFISSTLINIICFLNAEGDESRSRNPFEKIENKCLKLMIIWVFYTIFWLIFLILLLLASINVIRISYDINFNYKPEGKYANNIYYNCKGEGSPTVILLGGGSVPSFVWEETQNLISKYTKVCSYDRPGYGWSYNGFNKYIPSQVVEEMHDIIKDKSYTIVTHSVAGIYAWAFAKKYPNETAGLVFVDAQNNFSWDKNCPKISTFMTKLIRGLDPIGMVKFFAEGKLFPAMKDMNPTYKNEFISFISNGRHSEAEYQIDLYKQESCIENFKSIENENLQNIPIVAISAGHSMNSTCTSHYLNDEIACENHLSIVRKITPKMALQALTETKMSNKNKWVICSDCMHEIFIDSPEVISDSVLEITDDFRGNKQMKNNQDVFLTCRTRRNPNNWCADSLCDWCEDREECNNKKNDKRCNNKGINKLIYPKDSCTEGIPPNKEKCFDENCVKLECLNDFFPIDVKKGGVCPKNFNCIN